MCWGCAWGLRFADRLAIGCVCVHLKLNFAAECGDILVAGFMLIAGFMGDILIAGFMGSHSGLGCVSPLLVQSS